jgi:prolyl-tRNA editing enzyme YbaK/EbsC (Cys-tRNA(Pro) deacylase)
MAGRETPATKAAKRAGIDFRVLEYEHDAASESYGLEAAERRGLEIELAPGDLASLTGADTAALARR